MSAAAAARYTARAVGQTLNTAGVIVLLFVAYELWITNIFAANSQHRLLAQLHRQWQAPVVDPLQLGQGFALLFIPRFGPSYQRVIVQGTSVKDLQEGPGHYLGTALPGQIGNFVVSGHRTTYGAPFNHLDELRPGDPVIVETKSTWFTYDVTSTEVVLPDDFGVTYPVPNEPGVRPTKAMMTLTTCTPEYSATHRLIVFGVLEGKQPRSAGPPPGLIGA